MGSKVRSSFSVTPNANSLARRRTQLLPQDDTNWQRPLAIGGQRECSTLRKQVLTTRVSRGGRFYSQTMMDLIDLGERPHRRLTINRLVDATWTGASVAIGLILLPAIGLKALAECSPFAKKQKRKQPELPHSRLIT